MFKKSGMKKITVLFLTIMLTVTTVNGCMGMKKEQEAFDAFIERQFVETMEDNWLNAHIFMETPENFGVDITKVPVEISPEINDAYFEKIDEENQACREAFEAFNRSKLTDDQKDVYDTFAYELNNALDGSSEALKYISFDFATLSGSYTQIPTVLADLCLRNEEDIKALIQIVASVKTYLDSSADFLFEQEAHGTLMIDFDEIRSYCKKVVDAGMDGSTLASMQENIDAVDISRELKEGYKKQVAEVYESFYIPAYENILSVLDRLEPSKNNTCGLASIKNGKEAYEVMFRSATGTSKTIEEVQKMLENRLFESLEDLQRTALGDTDSYMAWVNGEITTGYEDFDSMLEDLSTAMKGDFPEIEDVQYDIRPLPKDMENSGVEAYYNIPALDHSGNQKIRVNTGEDTLDIGSLSTFATVAHEGFPGHMYQYNYCYDLDITNWQKTVAASDGFVEGYATYVQQYALKYLEDVDEDAIKIEQLMNDINFMAVALSDIGIHYEGWNEEELADYLTSVGLNGEASKDLYQQLLVNPAVFLSYYVGYAEILELKENAKKALGDQFNDQAFHEALLKDGGAIFDVVSKNINAYIKEILKNK
ncbi:MAG: DUF885 domain-containing protein [Clostridiales bacterium]|nr:DUF885 domain-containing protein [Clostridiales bacterium]